MGHAIQRISTLAIGAGNKYILSLISQMISQLSFVTFKTHNTFHQTTNNKEDDDNNNNNNNNNKTTTINQSEVT